MIKSLCSYCYFYVGFGWMLWDWDWCEGNFIKRVAQAYSGKLTRVSLYFPNVNTTNIHQCSIISKWRAGKLHQSNFIPWYSMLFHFFPLTNRRTGNTSSNFSVPHKVWYSKLQLTRCLNAIQSHCFCYRAIQWVNYTVML